LIYIIDHENLIIYIHNTEKHQGKIGFFFLLTTLLS
jgi:hypothetical protein